MSQNGATTVSITTFRTTTLSIVGLIMALGINIVIVDKESHHAEFCNVINLFVFYYYSCLNAFMMSVIQMSAIYVKCRVLLLC